MARRIAAAFLLVTACPLCTSAWAGSSNTVNPAHSIADPPNGPPTTPWHNSYFISDRRAATAQSVLPSRPEERARTFLREHLSKSGGIAANSEFEIAHITPRDALNRSHVRLQQTVSGIRVRGGEALVHLDEDGVNSASVKLLDTFATPEFSAPAIPSGAAVGIARNVLAAKYPSAQASFSVPALEIFDPGLLGNAPHVPRLSWFIEARTSRASEYVWVDALDGRVLLSFNQNPTALNRQIWDGRNSTTLSTVIARSEGENPSRITAVNALYDIFGAYYGYLATRFDRDSLDGKGLMMVGVARACDPALPCPMTNAFWDGQRINIGNGFEVEDVVAHELTHGLIQYSANFLYLNQSGALSESYSDILGETIQQSDANHTTNPSQRWLIGEDLDIPGFISAGTALRSMADPTLYSEPATTLDANYACNPDIDNGGVHTNSGVGNKAFVLMVDGGEFNGYTIRGIGLSKAIAVQYRALAQYLGSASSYLDNYNANVMACSDLLDARRLTLDDCAQVKKAMLSVYMTTPPCANASAPAPPPPAPMPATAASAFCPTGKLPRYVFFDNFEDTAADQWASSGNNAWNDAATGSLYSSGRARTGLYSLHGAGSATATDSSIAMRRNVAVPPNAWLHIDSNYVFETGLDAGVLEFSTDSGNTWRDAGALVTAGRNYDGGVAPGLNNRLAGRQAFTGNTTGYRTTLADLSTLSGQSARFRFRLATDQGIASPGWWIDNVAIYTCEDTGGLIVSGADPEIVTRQGTTVSITVALSRAPLVNVDLPIEAVDPATVRVSPSTLHFTPTNWNQAQHIYLTGISPEEKTFALLIGPSSSTDPGFEAQPAIRLSIHNVASNTTKVEEKKVGGGIVDLWIILTALVIRGRTRFGRRYEQRNTNA